jgi:3-hydroxyisobutyrate dehydrogenase-like beta-hydroxyacid dehydrogenase
MLSNEVVVREVCGPARLEAVPDGFIHVNHATISAQAAEEFAGHAAANGYGYVAAPVIGRPNAAAAGALTILAAGAPDAVDASLPMLEVMGRRVWRYGDAAQAANLAKISVNYLIVHALQALAESITLLERNGLDAGTFVQMINDSIFPGVIYGGYGDAIARASYRPAGFSTVLGLKDLMLAIEAAAQTGVDLPTGPILQELLAAAVSEVGEDADWAAIAEVTRRRSTRSSPGPLTPATESPTRLHRIPTGSNRHDVGRSLVTCCVGDVACRRACTMPRVWTPATTKPSIKAPVQRVWLPQ